MVCCNDDDRVKFAPICMSCHKHIEGSEIYRDALLCIINRRFKGKCYYTVQEWRDMNGYQKNKKDTN